MRSTQEDHVSINKQNRKVFHKFRTLKIPTLIIKIFTFVDTSIKLLIIFDYRE